MGAVLITGLSGAGKSTIAEALARRGVVLVTKGDAVTEDDVRRHAEAGVCSAKELRVACGMSPGCGQCVRRICALVSPAATDAGVSETAAA